ncbi:GNAT family N-acetyltransferase [Butyrivibrio sp. YAB3001]|uniref:GNAT family N-acetyltransferase n=1 Tax=Butyrivibrio sp. YAB3001 TaxID=1520812 RepID=UPI000A55F9C4|nr:GNAT family N-acetyltransferase [Butyrivibrio sp. YAB3001]
MYQEVDLSKIMVRCAYHSDWDGAMKLAWKTFIKFDAPDYSQEGIQNFHNFVNDDMLRKMFIAGHYQLFVAVDREKYVGMLTLREKKHISLLFVDENYHGNGVGSALIKYVSKYVSEEEGLDRITVNSAPYAREFYHKRGFKDLGPETVADGIRYTPMELRLRDMLQTKS